MARTVWQLETECEILVTLFAISTTGYWSRTKMSEFVDSAIANENYSEDWLIDLAFLLLDKDKTLDEIFISLIDSCKCTIPAYFDEICAGFAMKFYYEGGITSGKARSMLAEEADPSGIGGVYIEEISSIDLRDDRLRNLSTSASLLYDHVVQQENS